LDACHPSARGQRTQHVRIAIIGTGIAGMGAGWALQQSGHELTVFEAGNYIGGHTNTVPVVLDGQVWPVDTGFIVFNSWTYPNFIRLLDHLGVPSRPTTMGFSVRDERNGLEYAGASVATLFAQWRNVLRPSHIGMIRDILRFNREAPSLLHGDDHRTTLGDYLTAQRYSRAFIERYIVPMGSAIWSAPEGDLLRFPVRFFVRFFHNHGMLSVDERPVWRTVSGGSASYIPLLVRGFRERIRLDTPVQSVVRDADGVTITSRVGVERFDQVIFACHSDQALALLGDASDDERTILGALPYQMNEAVLHTDVRMMPRTRSTWSAWNYHVLGDSTRPVALTYDMNILQGFESAPKRFLVTLNRSDAIDPASVIQRIRYHHPVYSVPGVAAQARWNDINGTRRSWFCGAYWRYGFHEDGLWSGLRVAAGLGSLAPWGQPIVEDRLVTVPP